MENAVTATQNDIMQSFNLTAVSVKKEADISWRQLAEYMGYEARAISEEFVSTQT